MESVFTQYQNPSQFSVVSSYTEIQVRLYFSLIKGIESPILWASEHDCDNSSRHSTTRIRLKARDLDSWDIIIPG